MSMSSRIMIAVAVSGVLVGGIAAAQKAKLGKPQANQLSGKYGMALSQVCVLAPVGPPPATGFEAKTGRLLADAETVSAVSHGLMRFEASGATSIEGVLTEIFHEKVKAGDSPVTAGHKYGCRGSYKLDDGGTLAVELACEVEPPKPDMTITLKPFHLTGYVGRNREDLNLTAAEGNVQTLEVAVGGRVVQQRERICNQSLSLTSLPSGPAKD
jgi:hypothetical protein